MNHLGAVMWHFDFGNYRMRAGSSSGVPNELAFGITHHRTERGICMHRYNVLRGHSVAATLRYVPSILGMLMLTSCAGQFELSRRSQVAQPRGVSVHSAVPAEAHAPSAPPDALSVADEVADVNELCARKQTAIQDRQTAA